MISKGLANMTLRLGEKGAKVGFIAELELISSFITQ